MNLGNKVLSFYALSWPVAEADVSGAALCLTFDLALKMLCKPAPISSFMPCDRCECIFRTEQGSGGLRSHRCK